MGLDDFEKRRDEAARKHEPSGFEMTLAELNAERDRLAYDFCGQYGFDEALLEGFRAGFDAAVKLMEERRVKPLREVIENYIEINVTLYPNDEPSQATQDFSDALAQVPLLENV